MSQETPTKSVAISKTKPAKVRARTAALKKGVINKFECKTCPKEYYKFDKLELFYKNKTTRSVDINGSKKYKIQANVHLDYVTQLQKDLITLGYLPQKDDKKNNSADGYYGSPTQRAVLRFKRHAKRLYRMTEDGTVDDIKADEIFGGIENTTCDYATAQEIRKWIDKTWVVPVGRFDIVDIGNNGKLREDAAEEWKKIVVAITAQGGTVGQKYGDTLRPLQKNNKKGASKYSVHYSGRAVDLQQELANPDNKKLKRVKRYFVVKEPNAGKMYWRIYCKTEQQDGTQGTKYDKGKIKFWDFFAKKEESAPKGYYFDLTAVIESNGKFRRIPAHKGWENNTDLSEWWHYYYTPDKQLTFLDELELIGYSEAEVQNRGWKSIKELDHTPG